MRAILVLFGVLVLFFVLWQVLKPADEPGATPGTGGEPSSGAGGAPEADSGKPPGPAPGGTTEPVTAEENREGWRKREAPPPSAPGEATDRPGEERSPPGEAPAPPETVSATKLLGEAKVTLELDDVTAPAALVLIADQAGVRIDVAEDLLAELEGARLSLAVTELEGDSALELVLALVRPGLSFVEKGGRILVHRAD
jgi:hypothetical protein